MEIAFWVDWERDYADYNNQSLVNKLPSMIECRINLALTGENGLLNGIGSDNAK